ncbi:Gfo/Idh/MocA family protein [Pararhodonellum marinum]|uniref:Gfo/Idh/MocA family protein n=1 Tax=Pararhodonellum marinum TaxID=2755358 RepID=UPI00188E86D1|nr:Gfo/Idh/MocA family oxidoreductase [Pararhodonellum marinum]
MNRVKVGIIGGGLMGKEAASAFGRWFTLEDHPVIPELVAVCDLNPKVLEWYKKIPTVKLLTTEVEELLDEESIEVVYVAVPHHLHESLYSKVLQAGKDLLAEKPFGIDLAAARAILHTADQLGRFVRCSSEFPFMPGAQRAFKAAMAADFGQIIQIRSGFLHSSDMDPDKPINWKRQVKYCGETGVMGDLGMHALHLPLRLGFYPKKVFAQLQNIYHQRPDGKGGMANCDTWDNAMLYTEVEVRGTSVPMNLEMKRLAPGETNTWYIEIDGTDNGVRFSTKSPKTLWTFHREKEQSWKRTDLGFNSVFPTITGGIFEPGFPDIFQQMLAAFFMERAGLLGEGFGCVTPLEAVMSQEIFAAAGISHQLGKSVAMENQKINEKI